MADQGTLDKVGAFERGGAVETSKQEVRDSGQSPHTECFLNPSGVGCQVIEETRAAQPHRRRIQSASLAESARDEGCREGESPNY
ncbi:hypothetical protein D4764_08G0011000 [Takifugu flavidus]|uniref:Uncharacterized protein n=1 Tax=Takifugu flavidus TaxID=433684 RepID=A0A5C6MQD8_9TELE|nr:hypothetical protein D4764_08G0011000 [Takifugu flavidus]